MSQPLASQPIDPTRPDEGRGARVGYLGPRGTFSEEALLDSVDSEAVDPIPMASIHEAVMAVHEGRVRWSLVPIENSSEGSVTATLDALAGEAGDVRLVGEVVHPVRQCLIARNDIDLAQLTTVVSHPQATGQCARFLREHLPGARVLPASSTAHAVRMVAEAAEGGQAAIGPRLAASAYGCVVLREAIQDHADNETRFVWLARGDARLPPPPRTGRGPGRTSTRGRKTSVLFWGTGSGQAGWLVACLDEFARRQVNLTKIESRPRRQRLGRYVFFLDLLGGEEETPVQQAIAGLRSHCDHVRVLGSFAVADPSGASDA